MSNNEETNPAIKSSDKIDNNQACKQEHESHSQESQWLRLSPLSILFFLAKTIGQLINQALPALAPVGVLVFNADNKSTTILMVAIGLISFVVINAILQYYFFRFKISQDKITLHEGVFNKNQRIISYHKVQNINLLQPFYFKFFNLINLQLETAGSKNNEANLAGLHQLQADNLKQLILNNRSNTVEETVETAGITENNSPEQSLSKSTTKDIIKFGLTNNGMFWFFVFLSPFAGKMDDIIEKWVGSENIEALISNLGGGTLGTTLMFFLVIISIVLLMLVFSILGAVFRYHNYVLTLKGNTLKRHSGLLSTHEESAKLDKIQAFVNKTNFIGRWLKIENIYLKQTTAMANNQSAKRKLFVVPTLNRERTNSLLNTIIGLNQLHPNLIKINRRYIFKTWLIFISMPILLCTLIFIATKSFWALFILLMGLPIWTLITIRWNNYGYFIDDEFATFRSGFVGYRRITFALFKVQRIIITQSPMQKKRKLANLQIFLASDRITIPYMPMSEATDWFDKISYKIETTDKNWF